MHIDKLKNKLAKEKSPRPTCPHCRSKRVMWKDGTIANRKYQRFRCPSCDIRVRVAIDTGIMSRIYRPRVKNE